MKLWPIALIGGIGLLAVTRQRRVQRRKARQEARAERKSGYTPAPTNNV